MPAAAVAWAPGATNDAAWWPRCGREHAVSAASHAPAAKLFCNFRSSGGGRPGSRVTVERHLVQSPPSGNLETSLARIGSTNAAVTFGRPAMRACGLLVARPRLLDQRLRRRTNTLSARGGFFDTGPQRWSRSVGRRRVAAIPQRPRPRSSRNCFVIFVRRVAGPPVSRAPARILGYSTQAPVPVGWPPPGSRPYLSGLDGAPPKIVL